MSVEWENVISNALSTIGGGLIATFISYKYNESKEKKRVENDKKTQIELLALAKRNQLELKNLEKIQELLHLFYEYIAIAYRSESNERVKLGYRLLTTSKLVSRLPQTPVAGKDIEQIELSINKVNAWHDRDKENKYGLTKLEDDLNPIMIELSKYLIL